MQNWNTKKSRALYNVDNWGAGYFDINAQGHLQICPTQEPDRSIDIYEVVQAALDQGHRLPLLLRFSDILRHRVHSLALAFSAAIKAEAYSGSYTAIYPIKVNQQHSVVNELLASDEPVGLEAGSKSELMAVLGVSAQLDQTIVCNGYKDREYIRLALTGQKLGQRIYLVIEKLSELELVLEQAAVLQVQPRLGLRVRLASIGEGKWQNTGGEKSKFGLSAAQVLTMLARLREAGKLDYLQMLHFHLGSQLANIRDIQCGMQECARYYAELHRLGAAIDCVDVGGGLGVDYEGSHSRHACSMNYSLDSYARHIVHALKEICQQQDLPHPQIMTESGRAMTAHHALLVTNVINTEQVPTGNMNAVSDINTQMPTALQELGQLHALLVEGNISSHAAIEAWHDVRYWLGEAQTLYTHGMLELEQRAAAEALYFACCRYIRNCLSPLQRSHREVLDALNEKLADKYFCNFSLFQSIPDAWGIGQIFPVMPLHRLQEKPSRRGVIEDITCDSDGRINEYVEAEGIETSLPLHEWNAGEPYLLGIFLVGAYQEILGDMHNLFGDTDSLHIRLSGEGYRLEQPCEGDRVDDLLRYVHFDPDDLIQNYHAKIAAADLSAQEKQGCLETLLSGVAGYSYLQN
ncbi:Biosynthetic arginine decarboxylase [hydrothermal vent metagenome]|uniref:arginine decarboxylase n=1 Tax=hydrothermal vent metagenome TaxID=652676 RepID=A0A3B1BSA8_9ZZZZ